MRYFDLRSSLPKLDRQWTEEAALFEQAPLPRRLHVPVKAGAKVRGAGTEVAAGEALTEDGAAAPVAGRIIGETTVRLPRGPEVPAVELETAEHVVVPAAAEAQVPTREKLGEWIGKLERAGLGAERQSSPDLLGQLRRAGQTRVETVICSMLDGDAALRLNAAVAARQPEELAAGLDFLDNLLLPKRVWVVEDETAPPDWVTPVREAVQSKRRRMVSMRNDYPESDPTLLLFTLLKRKLRPGHSPVEAGVVLLDAVAAVALGRFALTGRVQSSIPVAVHHPEWPATRYADATVGTRLSEVVGAMGLRADEYVVRTGDLLRDGKITPDAVIGNGELTFHVTYPERDENPDPCIRCGWCIEGCPVRIHPAGLLEAAQREDERLGRHYGLEACIECGICTYVCPSRLPILTGIRKLRAGNKNA